MRIFSEGVVAWLLGATEAVRCWFSTAVIQFSVDGEGLADFQSHFASLLSSVSAPLVFLRWDNGLLLICLRQHGFARETNSPSILWACRSLPPPLHPSSLNTKFKSNLYFLCRARLSSASHPENPFFLIISFTLNICLVWGFSPGRRRAEELQWSFSLDQCEQSKSRLDCLDVLELWSPTPSPYLQLWLHQHRLFILHVLICHLWHHNCEVNTPGCWQDYKKTTQDKNKEQKLQSENLPSPPSSDLLTPKAGDGVATGQSHKHLNSWLLPSRSMTWWLTTPLEFKNCGSTHS